jgi:hypothetical protein
MDYHDPREPIAACIIDSWKLFRWRVTMAETNCSSHIVPYGADQTLYLVVDGYGGGASRRELEIERTDLEAAICELMSGQFNDPVRVIAYNTLEHWSEDVSAEVALEIQSRCDMDGCDLPEHIKDFVERSTRRVRRSAASSSGPARSLARLGY